MNPLPTLNYLSPHEMISEKNIHILVYSFSKCRSWLNLVLNHIEFYKN